MNTIGWISLIVPCLTLFLFCLLSVFISLFILLSCLYSLALMSLTSPAAQVSSGSSFPLLCSSHFITYVCFKAFQKCSRNTFEINLIPSTRVSSSRQDCCRMDLQFSGCGDSRRFCFTCVWKRDVQRSGFYWKHCTGFDF